MVCGRNSAPAACGLVATLVAVLLAPGPAAAAQVASAFSQRALARVYPDSGADANPVVVIRAGTGVPVRIAIRHDLLANRGRDG
jgi:hypothetical protein